MTDEERLTELMRVHGTDLNEYFELRLRIAEEKKARERKERKRVEDMTLTEWIHYDAQRTIERYSNAPKELQPEWFRKRYECRDELKMCNGSSVCMCYEAKEHLGLHNGYYYGKRIYWEEA